MNKGKKPAKVQQSIGNVFADLALPNARGRLAKAKVADRICEVIAARGLTQAEAANIMGLDQPKISALVRGNLKGFSTDRFFRCLNDLGQEIEITFGPPSKLVGEVTPKFALPSESWRSVVS